MRDNRAESASDGGIVREVVAPVARALADLGYAVDLSSPQPEVVEGAGADRLLDDAAEALGTPALGIAIATAIPLGGIGLMDYAFCTSPTLRDALELVVNHYAKLTDRAAWTLSEESSDAKMVFSRPAAIVISHHWTEFAFAAVCTRIRQTLGHDVVFRAELSHSAPPSSRAHDEFFLAQVKFDRPANVLRFPARWLSEPLRTANRALASLLAQRLRDARPVHGGDPLLERARGAIASSLDAGDARVESAARALGLSRRTLQRVLAERSTSHRELLDEIRRGRAFSLLEEGLKIDAVARQLGFRDPSAFFRAFRRWTGTSPRAGRSGTPSAQGRDGALVR